MAYVQKESETNQPSLKKMKLKNGIWDSQYDKQRICVLGLDGSGGVE